MPRPYIKLLVELEDYLNKSLADRVARKKMSPTNARALNTMRQRLKKHNVAYQAQIDTFRAKPESSEEENASGAARSMVWTPSAGFNHCMLIALACGR